MLSGFLITTILLGEHARTGAISLRAFYLRRMLRLFPALLVLLAAVAIGLRFVMIPAFGYRPSQEAVTNSFLYPLAYVFNWVVASNRPFLEALVHLWSLSVEEQYYLLWPGLLAVSLRLGVSRRGLAGLTLALIFASALIPFVWSGWTWQRLFYASDYRAHALLIGSLLGQLWVDGRFSPERVRSVPFRAAALLSTAVLVWVVVVARIDDRFLYLGGFPLIAAASAVLVVNAAFADRSSWAGVILTARPLVWLGKRSYAIYLYHLPVAAWTEWLEFPVLSATLVCGFVSIYAAALSYRYVEQPALRYKERLGRRRGETEASAPAAS